ncbi:MAG: 50S ribosomal protein L1 [Candidatus Aenigmarchaeota archaeon]|nr:50S ribosomal protein L1 [Candidatus Aenigmarchaeota archaeon]
MGIAEKLKEAREGSKPRKFAQAWDLIFVLRDIDLKKPENRLNLEFFLPGGIGKELKTAVVADSLIPDAKKHADIVITKDEIPALGKNKKKLRKLARDYDWWFGEAPLMPLIGKQLGAILGTRGKMPKPVPPKINMESLIKRSKGLVKIRLTNTPVIQVMVGTESMPDEDVTKNIEGMINFVREHLPKGKNNIKNVLLKLTMGKPVKLEM